jgi:hypothetical protein
MRFLPAERFIAIIVAILAIADLALITRGGIAVDWPGYAGAIALGGGSVALGLIYRKIGRDDGIALATISAGLFILFTIAGSVFNYMLIPFAGERIDAELMRVDAILGYDWAVYVAWMAQHGWLMPVLGAIYISSLPQLIVVTVILGFSRRREQLHRFMLTGIFGALTAIAIWGIAPSSGPSAVVTVAEAVAANASLVVTPAYGAELNRLFAEGVILLSPRDTLGLIAFPSFHTVMALMSVWFIPRRAALFLPFLTVNILMMPAILLHGGHHLVDLFAGIILFAFALVASNRVAARLEAMERGPSAANAAPELA